MASSPDSVSMALFCDFENVALGVRDARYEKFDIKRVLERLLLKGSIVVKKAYCDWDRYKGFKAAMHEANFELIEIPHLRQSGKNSADIRLVVDALDLCYTKSHVDTFVIISGDSDFSPLVSKLRENAKQVIGVGVKQSTSDLLIANCDEFIFYDDLVRDSERSTSRREGRGESASGGTKKGEEGRPRKDDMEARRTHAIEIAVETFDALFAERGDRGKIWASMLKDAIKRRKPDFNETYFGFKAFGNLLEEAQARGLLSFGRDEKSGAYVYRRTAGAESSMDEGAQSARIAPTEDVAPAAALSAAPVQGEDTQPGAGPAAGAEGSKGRGEAGKSRKGPSKEGQSARRTTSPRRTRKTVETAETAETAGTAESVASAAPPERPAAPMEESVPVPPESDVAAARSVPDEAAEPATGKALSPAPARKKAAAGSRRSTRRTDKVTGEGAEGRELAADVQAVQVTEAAPAAPASPAAPEGAAVSPVTAAPSGDEVAPAKPAPRRRSPRKKAAASGEGGAGAKVAGAEGGE